MSFADLRECSSRTLDFSSSENALTPWTTDIGPVDLGLDGRDSPDVHLEPFEIAGLMPEEALYQGKGVRFFTDWTEFGLKVDPSGDVLADAPSLSDWKFGRSNPANPRPGSASPEVLDLLSPLSRLLAQAASRRYLSQRGMTSATALLAVVVVSGALSAFHHFGFVEFKLAMTDQLVQRNR